MREKAKRLSASWDKQYNLHYKSDAMIDDVIIQAADMGIKSHSHVGVL